MALVGRKPGLPKTGGRQKGTPNKVDASIKDMIMGALITVGGTEYLARQAEQNPVAFMGLIGKVLPLQLAGHDGGKLIVDFRWASDDEPKTIEATAVDTVDADVDTVDTPAVTFIGEC